MLESLTGLILIIGSGLIGQDTLLREQPALKPTIHHLEAYRDAIGMSLLILSLGGLYHAISTALTHQYTPIFWCMWSLSNLCGFMFSVTLCFELWDLRLSIAHPRIHQAGSIICTFVDRHLSWLCWSGLALGSWRAIHPWMG